MNSMLSHAMTVTYTWDGTFHYPDNVWVCPRCHTPSNYYRLGSGSLWVDGSGVYYTETRTECERCYCGYLYRSVQS